MSQAHVISCNDKVVAVCLGDELQARLNMEREAAKDYERNKWHWTSSAERYHFGDNPYQYYRRICHWHTNAVPILGDDHA